MTIRKSVQLTGEAGQGPAVVFLRGSNAVSKAVSYLAKDFHVLSIAIDPSAPSDEVVLDLSQALNALPPAALVADASTTASAVALARAKPTLVQSLALLSPDTAGDTADLAVPVLAMFGTADKDLDPGAPRAFCRSVPNCRLVYVYDAARALDDDRPEAVASVLSDFAARREGFLVNDKRGDLHP